MCQVGVFLALINDGYQTLIDGELYIPEAWFAPENAAKYKRIGIPEERVFATKLEIGLQMITRTQANEVPSEYRILRGYSQEYAPLSEKADGLFSPKPQGEKSQGTGFPF